MFKWPVRKVVFLFLIGIRIILLDYIFTICFALTGIVRGR